MSTTTVALAELHVDAAANPRGEDLGDIAELVASIKTHGVLQPVIVEPHLVEGLVDEPCPWRLVAGYRRVAAATKLGLDHVDAVVVEPQDAVAVPLVENLQRENLHPIAEARALDAIRKAIPTRGKPMTQKKLAALVGKSESWVSARLQLLDTPPKVIDLMMAGTVPLVAGERLREIAAHSPAVAEAVAEGMAAWADTEEWQNFAEDPGDVMDRFEDDSIETPFLLRVFAHQPVPIEPLDLEDETAAAAKALPWHVLQFEPQDLDAARAYGCLLELSARHGRVSRYITDKAWAQALVIDKVAGYQRPAPAANGAGDFAPEVKPKGQSKEAREARDAARLANTNLGAALWKEYSTVDVALDSMRFVAGVIAMTMAGDLGNALGIVREEWQKTGRSVDYGFGTNGDRFQAAVMSARTPEAILGLIVQAVTAGWWMDETALPQSARQYAWSPYQLDHASIEKSGLMKHVRSWVLDVGREVAGQHLLDRKARAVEAHDRATAVGADGAEDDGRGEDADEAMAEAQEATQGRQITGYERANGEPLPEGKTTCPECDGDGGAEDGDDCAGCEGRGFVDAETVASA